MRATQTLPEGYRSAGTIDIHKKRTLLLISLLGLILMCAFGFLFTDLLAFLRPTDFANHLRDMPFGLKSILLQTLAMLAILVPMLLLHEALHGLAFWIFSRSRPRFAFKTFYAYASLPGWYLPRSQYLVSALLPFTFITVLGVLLLWLLPPTWFIPMLLVMVANAAGSVGDLVVAVWLLTRQRGTLAMDAGDAVTLYEPERN
jgi:hypothetical protein